MIGQKENSAYARFMRGLKGGEAPEVASPTNPLASLSGLREKVRSEQGSPTSHQPSRVFADSPSSGGSSNQSDKGARMSVSRITVGLILMVIYGAVAIYLKGKDQDWLNSPAGLYHLEQKKMEIENKRLELLVEAGVNPSSVPGYQPSVTRQPVSSGILMSQGQRHILGAGKSFVFKGPVTVYPVIARGRIESIAGNYQLFSIDGKPTTLDEINRGKEDVTTVKIVVATDQTATITTRKE
jgi:hypothetical protein